MIIKFDMEKEYENVLDETKKAVVVMKKEIKQSVDNYRMSNLSFGIYDYDEIQTASTFKMVMAEAQISSRAFAILMSKSAEMCAKSFIYISSILKEEGEDTSGENMKKFLLSFSNNSEKEKSFISFWYRIRNKWVHESKLQEDPAFAKKWFPKTSLLDMQEIIDVINPIFQKINSKYPGKIIGDINFEDVPDILGF